MPALIHFRRRWLLACDDLVIPYAIEAVLRIIWLCGTSVMTWLEFSGSSSLFIKYFLVAFICELLVSIFLCLGISVISARGSVLQTHKRAYLSAVLYAKFTTVFCDLGLACYLVWFLLGESNISVEYKIFCEAASVCLSLYVFAVIIGCFVCYNSLGSSSYWNNNSENSIQIFKKAERIWRLRLKFFCCCADVSENENDFIYVEIATFLATFSSDIDLAPTDILAGLITISKKHAIERRKTKYQRILKCETLLENKPKPLWMTAENALYYLRIAKSTYGWLAFFDTLRPWRLCTLLSPSRCFSSCSHENNMQHGDCCYCNSTAVEKISGLSDSDVLYASFSNSIHEPAFIIVMDHDKKSVVIAIRGTRSFSDLITDINADEMNFPEEISSQKLKCHRGALRSALFIYKKINELNILKSAFAENPSYMLILTGHSLGGSIASILGLLLHSEYPTLQCYSYAPLAVLSAEGIPKTIEFVFSIVVGDDIVPWFSVGSCKELFRQLYKSLEETQIPKYKILTKAFCHYVKKSLKMFHKASPISHIYENQQVQIEEESSQEQIQINIIPNEVQLYAPGRILHLRRGEGCDYSWVTGFNFQSILISPHIIKDHQPHQIQYFLDKYKSSIESSTSGEIFSIRL